MATFQFDKSFQQRYSEFELILDSDENLSVQEIWKTFMEGSIEPAGYSAIWKLSKADCERYAVNYPCEVYGVVQQTVFEEFAVLLIVLSVEDESVHLPEVCQVPYEDIFPCLEQENSALNVELTADCLDRYRFFFNYIFFPWDRNDSDLGKELSSRMQLFFDLKNKNLSKGLSSHVRRMIAEAKYIQRKRDNIELSIDNTDEDLDISSSSGSKEVARNLLILHLRLMKIKHEVEIMLNPEMRAIYEEVTFPHHAIAKSKETNFFVVSKQSTMAEMKELIERLSKKVKADQKVHWMSLQDSFAALSVSSEIYIQAGIHSVNFLEFLNDKVLLSGLDDISITSFDFQKHRYATLSAEDYGSFLFAIDGGFRLENLVIDCEKVKTGFLIKDGKVEIRNCVIYGSKDSSVTEGFSVSGTAEVSIDSCLIYNFASGFAISESASVKIQNSTIKVKYSHLQ